MPYGEISDEPPAGLSEDKISRWGSNVRRGTRAYIKDLNNTHSLTQEDLGIRFANKLSRRHMEFHQQKMKVSLAPSAPYSQVSLAGGGGGGG